MDKYTEIHNVQGWSNIVDSDTLHDLAVSVEHQIDYAVEHIDSGTISFEFENGKTYLAEYTVGLRIFDEETGNEVCELTPRELRR